MVAQALSALASVESEAGDHESARAYAERALELRLATYGPESVPYGRALRTLAFVEYRAGHHDTALEMYEQGQELLDRIEHVTPRVEVEIDPGVLSLYAGEYELDSGMVFDVIVRDEQLQIKLGDQLRFPVYPESERKFFYKVSNAQITFVVDESGEVTGLMLHQDSRDQEAKKM